MKLLGTKKMSKDDNARAGRGEKHQESADGYLRPCFAE